MADNIWPWVALAALGAFHGINPAMGWLFAVALGLHRHSRNVVLTSLVPLALGHLASASLVALAFVWLGLVADAQLVRLIAGLLLIGWAIYHYFYGHRHRVRVGLTTGMVGLALWSFLMATAHGAGLMLVPVLMPLCRAVAAGGDSPFPIAVAGLAVHTAAMLAVTGLIAIVVYEWIGLAFLRHAWFNLDLVWSAALFAAGLVVLFA
jgi:hypothetical protein